MHRNRGRLLPGKRYIMQQQIHSITAVGKPCHCESTSCGTDSDPRKPHNDPEILKHTLRWIMRGWSSGPWRAERHVSTYGLQQEQRRSTGSSSAWDMRSSGAHIITHEQRLCKHRDLEPTLWISAWMNKLCSINLPH